MRADSASFDAPATSSEPEPATPVVVVEKVSKRYGRTVALDGVSLEVASGSLFALLGPNGAGKTTLLNILTTTLRPDAGKASVAGFDVVRQPRLARRSIGVAFQEPSLDARLTVRENLNFHAMVYGVDIPTRKARIPEMLELVELSDWSDHLARSLSSGMKRRLEIARALLHRPRILFLDEPTAGLDAQSRERIWGYLEALRRTGDLTILVTTHYIEEVEYCDRVCIIDHGTVLTQGPPQELKARHGQELIRVRPRTEEIGKAILARYPDARVTAGGEVIIKVAGPSFVDGFLSEFGTSVSQVAFDISNLETVFLTLTGRDLRDRAADPRERTFAFGQAGGEHTR